MDNLEELAGLPVVVWESGDDLKNPSGEAYRIYVEYDAEDPWVDVFAEFIETPGVERVKALSIGNWGEVASGDGPEPIIEALVGARQHLPALEALFFGDIMQEEAEISWIQQGDLSPLLSAFPELRELGVRGAQNLSLGRVNHARLEKLVIESGGLNRGVVEQVLTGSLPSLAHLELYLGDDGYGANTTVADFERLLSGQLFPKLRRLGLRNCQYVDQLCQALAEAKLLERLSVLDLSLGILTDAGGEWLLRAPALKQLTRLDLHHHFLSEAMQKRLSALPIQVDLSQPQQADRDGDDTYRYVAVSE